jgi:hypothetical protein
VISIEDKIQLIVQKSNVSDIKELLDSIRINRREVTICDKEGLEAVKLGDLSAEKARAELRSMLAEKPAFRRVVELPLESLISKRELYKDYEEAPFLEALRNTSGVEVDSPERNFIDKLATMRLKLGL